MDECDYCGKIRVSHNGAKLLRFSLEPAYALPTTGSSRMRLCQIRKRARLCREALTSADAFRRRLQRAPGRRLREVPTQVIARADIGGDSCEVQVRCVDRQTGSVLAGLFKERERPERTLAPPRHEETVQGHRAAAAAQATGTAFKSARRDSGERRSSLSEA
eukprot:6180751-Pleurochrysis_carterae.AAC.3